MIPRTRYAKSGDVHIAYQVFGQGDQDLVYVPTSFSQLEHLWEEPSVARYLERLGSFARVILFDRRGAGLSDPVVSQTLEDQMADVTAVMDAAGSGKAALLAQLEGTPMAILYAATFPERVQAMVLITGFARTTWAEGYEWARPADDRERDFIEPTVAAWGEGPRALALAPSAAGDPGFLEWWGKLERLSASPGQIRRLLRFVGEVDVRDVLPQVRVPTLVMRRRDDTQFDVRHSRYLAEHIPGARYVEVPGRDPVVPFGDATPVVEEVRELLTGSRTSPDVDRVLATVVFTDIADSTERAASLGDRRWRELLEQHDAIGRLHVEQQGGRWVKSTGDGMLATFAGPARAVQAAESIVDAVGELGLEVRAGAHTGEVELLGDDVGGLAVHIAARIAAAARPREVLTSSTVRDLVAGSGIAFVERGTHELRGVPGTWSLLAVERPGTVVSAPHPFEEADRGA